MLSIKKDASMQRRSMFVFIGLIIFSLLISPVGAAQAQDRQPPLRVATPVAPPYHPPQGGWQESQDLHSTLSPAISEGILQNNVQSAVTLGQPGLSFRYVQTFGTTDEPYLADGTHLNKPNGLFIDGANNLYAAEESGHRLLKFNAAGANTLILGHAGQPWAHDDFLGWPVDTANDSDGNIWVAFNYAALKEFDASGNLLQIFPEIDPWMQGDTNDRFNNPWGIAFDSSGLMYISDQGNHRIQVYDISGGTPSYIETIGETGVPHSDNNGFNYPGQIAFDSLGRLYVMDSIGGNF